MKFYPYKKRGAAEKVLVMPGEGEGGGGHTMFYFLFFFVV